MIKILYNLLNQDDFYVTDPDIRFAKGEQKLPLTFKEAIKYAKRQIKTAWLTR